MLTPSLLVRACAADVRLEGHIREAAPVRLRVHVTPTAPARFEMYFQQCVIQVPNPLQGNSSVDGLLRACDRVEPSEACAIVAPQAWGTAYRPQTSTQPKNWLPMVHCVHDHPRDEEIIASLYIGSILLFAPSSRTYASLPTEFLSPLFTLVGIKRRITWHPSQPQPCPNLEVGQGSLVMSTACSSAFANPPSILVPSTRLPSFHIFSRTFPHSAPPATHAI
ncbi:hypothetical protein GQ44DRAFT_454810 [Phaeosphaeriaceae sp. PMI808]|nr:hypothetical protein GQ44DRAFT_454810 [Phaeosphaeriaceae sp. PMI808]